MDIFTRLTRLRSLRQRLGDSRERLYRIAYAWCHDATLADDLVQDTLRKALTHAEQLRDPAAMDAWLLRILTNCWRDHFRSQRDTLDIDDMELADEKTTDGQHEQGEIVKQIRQAVATLPIGQRQVLTLVDLEGSSYAEVADILGIPIGTVMSRLCRARQALKTLLLNDANRQAMMTEARTTVVSFRRKT